jgi:hypothetical protein
VAISVGLHAGRPRDPASVGGRPDAEKEREVQSRMPHIAALRGAPIACPRMPGALLSGESQREAAGTREICATAEP